MFIFVSNEFHEKYNETLDYCVSIHNSFCFLAGKCHSILIETSLNDISRMLDKYQSIYQQDIDYLYTYYKHRFYISIVALSKEVFNQLSRGVQHDLNWKGAEKTPSISWKRLFWKKFQRLYLSFNQKLASTQTLGVAFLDRIRKV